MHQGRGRRQFVFGADLPQAGEHGQHFGITPHQSRLGAAAIVVDLQLEAMLKTAPFCLAEFHGQQQPLLGGQIQAILLAAMQDQRPGEALQFLEMGGTHGLPLTLATPLQPMALAVTLLKGPLINSQGMTNGGQQRKQLHRPPVLHRSAAE